MSETVSASVSAENRQRQLDFVEVLQNQGRLERIEEFVDPEAVDHSAPPGLPGGPAGVRAVLGAIRQALPDHDAQVLHMVAEGDLVATYKTFTGTHSGDLFGLPPTGRRGTIRVMDFVRYREGLIVEHWNTVDVSGLT
jgi:predicted ester cyclase